MKRKSLIQAKLDEKTKVDFDEIHEDDLRSINKLILDEEDSLHDAKKSIKRYKENHTLTIGSDFVSLVENKKAIEARISLLKEIKKEHIESSENA